MKRVFFLSMLVAAALLTTITAVKAQKGIYIGAQGTRQMGVMINKDDANKPGADYKSKFSATFGINGGYNFSRNMGIGTEVMYSISRQRYVDHVTSYTQKFNYLKIPVLFTYNTNPAKNLMFIAKAGPQVGLLLNSKISDASNSALNGSAKDRYRKLTYGAVVGAGIRARMAQNIFLDAGVHFDGTFVNTEKKNYTGTRARTYDLNAGLEIGVKYFLK